MSDPNTGESQVILGAITAVRYRPLMYLGPNPVTHMVFEIMDMAIDAAYRGTCTQFTITLRRDNVVSIQDNSEGISVDIHPRLNTSLLELLFTKSHTGPPDDFPQLNPIVSGGYHGVGALAVNAASRWLSAEVARDGYLWSQFYQQGVPETPLTRVRTLLADEPTGTSITFKPDLSIFPTNVVLDTDLLSRRSQEVAHQLPQLAISVRDERGSEAKETRFHEQHGLSTLLDVQRLSNTVLLSQIPHTRIDDFQQISSNPYLRGLKIDISLQFTSGKISFQRGYATTIETTLDSTHMVGFRYGIRDPLNKLVPSNLRLRWKDIEPGLLIVISLWHPQPQFQSQLVTRFLIRQVQNPIRRAVRDTLLAFAAEHPDQIHRIIDHCIANRARRRPSRP
jgi:DNA gyrase subunit B